VLIKIIQVFLIRRGDEIGDHPSRFISKFLRRIRHQCQGSLGALGIGNELPDVLRVAASQVGPTPHHYLRRAGANTVSDL